MLSAVYRTLARLWATLRPGNLDSDLHAELESHIKLLEQEYLRRGAHADDAKRMARMAVGEITHLQESHREARSLPFLDILWQDLRYALRTLRHNAGFTTFAVLITGLGIGASATVFSTVNALLIRPLPFPDAQRLVWIYNLADDRVSEWNIQVGHFLDLREQNRSFSDLAAYFTSFQPGDSKLISGGVAERLNSLHVSQNFLSFVGASPFIGRNFTADECKWRAPGAAILSYGLWTRRYAADPAIVGRNITVNDQPVTVVGVAPRSFDFGSVFAPGYHADIYLPMALTPETNGWGNILAVIGRLRPGVSIQSARAEFHALADQLQREHPERNTLRPILAPLEEHVTGRLRRALLVLAWAVAVVMLVVCANVANLQLARSIARQKEMAVRAAIGAGRYRLIRQVLTESLLLSCSGALLGVFLALFGSRFLASLNAFKIPLLSTVRMDASSLGFSLLVAIVTGIVSGLAPAFQIPFAAVHDNLKESGRAFTGSKRHIWIRGALVISEIALACVLLVCAGLLSRSFLNLLNVDLGFQPERAAALRVDPGTAFASVTARDNYYKQILDRVRTLPGISGAGLSDVLPLAGDRSWDITAKGKIYRRGEFPEGFIRIISPGYLQAMGIALRTGRFFSEQDTRASEPVALVNETLARTLWPGQNAIGQVLMAEGSGSPGRRVIGMVADVRHRAVEKDSGCEVYMPLSQRGDSGSMFLVVRTALAPAALAASIRTALRPIAPDLSTNEFTTIQDLVNNAVSPRRFVVLLLAGFSAFALILAALGIYAVISYSVSQRAAEFGIRMALGASVSALQTRIVLQTLRLACMGMLIGSSAAWLVSRALGSLLFGISSTDPATFLGMMAVLTVVACLAGYLPALRVSKIEPITTLRAN